MWIFCGLCFVVRNVGIVTNNTFSCSRARNHENVQQVYLSWCSLASFFWHMNIYWFWRKSNKNPRFPHPVVTGGQQEQRHGVKTERDKENIRNTSRSVHWSIQRRLLVINRFVYFYIIKKISSSKLHFNLLDMFGSDKCVELSLIHTLWKKSSHRWSFVLSFVFREKISGRWFSF